MIATEPTALWNLPATEFPHRATVLWDVVAAAFPGNEPLRILELGVFRGTLFHELRRRADIRIAEYVGVDPFLGDESDMYTGVYWKDSTGAEAIHANSRKIFTSGGATLHRMCSHEFYDQSAGREWDVVIVDGDHRFQPALWDCHHWLRRVRVGGLLIADDYANADTPEVTRAVNSFVRRNRPAIEAAGYRVVPFANKEKEIPISLTIAYWKRGNGPMSRFTWPCGSDAPRESVVLAASPANPT